MSSFPDQSGGYRSAHNAPAELHRLETLGSNEVVDRSSLESRPHGKRWSRPLPGPGAGTPRYKVQAYLAFLRHDSTDSSPFTLQSE